MDCSPPGSPVMAFSRQENCSGLPFSSPGDLPHPGIKPWFYFRVISGWFFTICSTREAPKGQRENEEGKRTREGGGKHCRSEGTEAPGDWKADLANMVMLKHQEVEVDICHPPGRCVWWSWRHPYPLPRQRQLPCVGHHKVCYWPQCLSFPSQ